MIRYEFPFNERIRTLLRLEDLFDLTEQYAAKEGGDEHSVAIRSLLDIVDIAGRADLKMDMIQELERQRQFLKGFRNNPEISEAALDQAIAEIETANHGLVTMPGKFGQSLRENEWLMAVKGRIGIPGGLCEFDLPTYHFWQHRPAAFRRAQIETWLDTLQPVRKALNIILRQLRTSGLPKPVEASNGQYHRSLQGTTMQMAILDIDPSIPYVPEVSANRFALNVRFVEPELNAGEPRPRPTQQSLAFQLTLCSL